MSTALINRFELTMIDYVVILSNVINDIGVITDINDYGLLMASMEEDD